jgi:hypothetical protein
MVLSNFSSQITNSNFSGSFNKSHGRIYEVKIRPKLARIKSHKIFCKENFQKPVEKISNFLSIVIKIYQGELL